MGFGYLYSIIAAGVNSNSGTASFYVDSISEIQFSESAFDSLVLPGARKELILAFAESQLKCKKTFDDVIQGKGGLLGTVTHTRDIQPELTREIGKGIIMLLSGPPGVGKTLTAESGMSISP